MKEISEKSGNIISRIKSGDHFIEKRAVKRNGMEKEIIYDLAISEDLDILARLHGKEIIAKAAIATLRTDSDDEVEKNGKPMNFAKAAAAKIGAMSPEKQALANLQIQAIIEEWTPERLAEEIGKLPKATPKDEAPKDEPKKEGKKK